MTQRSQAAGPPSRGTAHNVASPEMLYVSG